MQKDLGIPDLSWHFMSLDGNALLSAGRRNNATHSWKLHDICIKKSGQV